MLAGTGVPDMVELNEGGLGFFTKGPLQDVGFVDLTERVDAAPAYPACSTSRSARSTRASAGRHARADPRPVEQA